VAGGGEGGGVLSNLTVLVRFFETGATAGTSGSEPSLSLCVRFNLLLACRSSLDDDGMAFDDDDVLLVLDVGEPVAELAARRAAARAAWVTGIWMPSDGRESDFRRVLYGMAAGCATDKYGMQRRYFRSPFCWAVVLLCCGLSDARRSSTRVRFKQSQGVAGFVPLGV